WAPTAGAAGSAISASPRFASASCRWCGSFSTGIDLCRDGDGVAMCMSGPAQQCAALEDAGRGEHVADPLAVAVAPARAALSTRRRDAPARLGVVEVIPHFVEQLVVGTEELRLDSLAEQLLMLVGPLG